jgi:hypothetical protein
MPRLERLVDRALARAWPDQARVRVCGSPIFVVGAPRSGTSMMQHALRAHSRLWGSAESDFLGPLIHSLQDIYERSCRRGPLNWLVRESVSLTEFTGAIGVGVNALYTARSAGKRWVEQTPEYTLFLPQLAEIFPGAMFVFMLRDGRDVAHSLRHFVHPLDHAEACRTWVRWTRAGMEFAASEHGDRLRVVRYAEAVRDPRAELSRVLAFVGERYEEGCAQVIERGPINSSFTTPAVPGRPRWSDWSEDELTEFDGIAGSLLVELGFEADSSWLASPTGQPG